MMPHDGPTSTPDTVGTPTDTRPAPVAAGNLRRYTLDHATATAWAGFYGAIKACVIPLWDDGDKPKPINSGWPDAAGMTHDEIVAWIMAGKPIGANLAKSGETGWAAFDADNAACTALLRSVGLKRTVITANAQVENHPKGKYDGGHFIVAAPPGFDPETLHTRGFVLPDGSKGDLLGGRRYIVLPPSGSDGSGGKIYMPDPEGWMVTGETMMAMGPWFANPDPEAYPEAPAGALGVLEPLRGMLGPKTVHERTVDESGEFRTQHQQQIDELISWDDAFACEEGAKFTVSGTDSCGCDMREFSEQTSKGGRGMTCHDGCAWGWFGRTWSGTAQALYDLPESTDRLRIAALLRGWEPGGDEEVRWAQGFGVAFPGRISNPADGWERDADMYEDRADDPAWCDGSVMVKVPPATPPVEETVARINASGKPYSVTFRRSSMDEWLTVPADRAYWLRQAAQCRAAASAVRGGQLPKHLQQPVETYSEGMAFGAPVPTIPYPQQEQQEQLAGDATGQEVPDNVRRLHAVPDPDPNESQDADADGDGGESTIDYTSLNGLEDLVTDFAGVAPVGDQMMRYPIPPKPAHVPDVKGARTAWHKVLPPIHTRHSHQFARHDWIWTATPGMSHVAAAADARAVNRWGMLGMLLPRLAAKIPPTVRLVPHHGDVPEGNAPTAQGTSLSVYTVGVAPPSGGKTVSMGAAGGLIPGVRTLAPGTGEGLLKEFPRAPEEVLEGDDSGDGSAPVITGLTESGLDASSLLMESDEMDVFVGEMLRQGTKTSGWYRSMWMGGEIGNTASDKERRSLVLAHTYRFGIALGAQPDSVAPLFRETGRGTPQRFIWLPAMVGVQRGTYPERLQIVEIDWLGSVPPAVSALPGMKAPVWVYPPPAAKPAMLRDHHRSVTAVPTESVRPEDQAASIAGHHATLYTNKIAALLAALDGLKQPQDIHWYVAEAIMEVRKAIIYELVADSKKVLKAGAVANGEMNGYTQAAALAVREADRELHIARCAETIMRALVRDVEDPKRGKPRRTYSDAIKALSSVKGTSGFSDQQLFGRDALDRVRTDPRIEDTGKHVRFAGDTAA